MRSDQGNMPGTILIGLLLSLPLLVLVPSVLLAAYKRALDRWMGAIAHGNLEDGEALSLPIRPRHPITAPALTYPPSRWLNLARSRQFRCAFVYAAGGGCAAAALTLALLSEASVSSLLPFLTILAANLWPVLLSVGAILRWRRQAWLRSMLIFFCVLGALAVLRHAFGAKAGIGQVFLLFILLNTPASIFYRAISLRAIRQVGPTLLPFCIAIVMGPQVLLHLGATHFSIALWIARLAMTLRLTNLGGIAVIVAVTLLFMALFGRGAAFLLVASYRIRQISDQMLLLDALWLLFVGTQALVLLTRTGHETGSGSAWVIAAFPLYLLIVRIGLLAVTPNRPLTSPAASLLVLRAFALQQRAEAIFQPVTAIWRYLGPVRLIGGPDLASATVDPGVFLEFVSRRLGTLFLRSVEDFEARMSRQSSTPDPDGRFRIDDFFCFKNTWQTAVSSLIPRSDVILADFRGLGHVKQGGCDWEVEELVRSSSLTRCVFLLDDSKDDLYLQSLLTAAATPEMPVDSAAVRIIHPKDLTDRSLKDLLSTLLAGISLVGLPSNGPQSEA